MGRADKQAYTQCRNAIVATGPRTYRRTDVVKFRERAPRAQWEPRMIEPRCSQDLDEETKARIRMAYLIECRGDREETVQELARRYNCLDVTVRLLTAGTPS